MEAPVVIPTLSENVAGQAGVDKAVAWHIRQAQVEMAPDTTGLCQMPLAPVILQTSTNVISNAEVGELRR